MNDSNTPDQWFVASDEKGSCDYLHSLELLPPFLSKSMFSSQIQGALTFPSPESAHGAIELLPEDLIGSCRVIHAKNGQLPSDSWRIRRTASTPSGAVIDYLHFDKTKAKVSFVGRASESTQTSLEEAKDLIRLVRSYHLKGDQTAELLPF